MYYYIVNLTSTAKNNRTHVVFGAKLEAEIEKFKTIYKLEKNFAKLTKELLGLIKPSSTSPCSDDGLQERLKSAKSLKLAKYT